MLELIAYPRANGFKTFIVSGGGVEFMRAWVEGVYGSPPSRWSEAARRSNTSCAGDLPVLVPLARGLDEAPKRGWVVVDMKKDWKVILPVSEIGVNVGAHGVRPEPSNSLARSREKDMADQKKPNILVIWGDDIGITNLSCYSDGLMGYRTPQHRQASRRKGCGSRIHTANSRCTAGRASFITGQSGFRTGLTKVGLPGAPVGLQAEDPTIAELLKPLGYATGQFGKNHLGDQNKFLPTVHGFDEFFGNLYHLNAEEDPEDPDYPDARSSRSSGQSSVRAVSSTARRPIRTIRPTSRDGAVSANRRSRTPVRSIESDGNVRRRFAAAAKEFIKRQHDAGKPFFCWVNFTHMHLRTHTKPSSLGQAGRWQSPYHDTMIDHDKNVGEVLTCWTSWASPTTRSSCTAPTTGRT